MEVEAIPSPPLSSFISRDLETPVQKLAQATPKGYLTLLVYAEAIGN